MAIADIGTHPNTEEHRHDPSIIRTATTAMAIVALAAPAALARPADMPPAVAKAAAAAQHEQAQRSADVSTPRPPLASAATSTRRAGAGRAGQPAAGDPAAGARRLQRIAWSTIGLGIAGLLAAPPSPGSSAARASRARTHRRLTTTAPGLPASAGIPGRRPAVVGAGVRRRGLRQTPEPKDASIR